MLYRPFNCGVVLNDKIATNYFLVFGLLGCEEKDNVKKLLEVTIDQDIPYVLHDPHHDPVEARGSLLKLVYDIPYFGACGVFPPFHLANQWFAQGGGDGGMGPGASWEPFSISQETYAQLTMQVEKTDPGTFYDSSKVFRMKFIFDRSFDHMQDRFAWAKVVCDRHREDFFERQEKQINKT